MSKKSNYPPVVRYPGELGTPHVRIRRAPSGGLLALMDGRPTEILEQEAQQANLDALGRRLVLLAEHYDAVAEGKIDWKKLAIELAFAHVPGFTTVESAPRKRGRPGRGYFNFELYEAVLSILDEGEPFVANACRKLSKRPGLWKGKNPSSLESRFHESRRKAATMDLRPHLSPPVALALFDVPPKPSDRYPPVPLKGGLFALGASALLNHEKP